MGARRRYRIPRTGLGGSCLNEPLIDPLDAATFSGEPSCRHGVFTTEVAPLTAPIMLLARTAAETDAELAAYLDAAESSRWRGWS